MFNHTKKLLTFATCITWLLAITMNASAVLPPKYLNVANFNQCLGTKDMGGWTAWCMPTTKPDSCPDESWQQLDSLTGRDRVPNC